MTETTSNSTSLECGYCVFSPAEIQARGCGGCGMPGRRHKTPEDCIAGLLRHIERLVTCCLIARQNNDRKIEMLRHLLAILDSYRTSDHEKQTCARRHLRRGAKPKIRMLLRRRKKEP